jgi:hypothetical protein
MKIILLLSIFATLSSCSSMRGCEDKEMCERQREHNEEMWQRQQMMFDRIR